jgi:hypothetical protein
MWDTNAEYIANTLEWFRNNVTMPFHSSEISAIPEARVLIAALNNPSPASPISPLDESQHEQLH